MNSAAVAAAAGTTAAVAVHLPVPSSRGRRTSSVGSFNSFAMPACPGTALDTTLLSWHPDSRPPLPRGSSETNLDISLKELEKTSGLTARLFAEIQASIALLENEIRSSTSVR